MTRDIKSDKRVYFEYKKIIGGFYGESSVELIIRLPAGG